MNKKTIITSLLPLVVMTFASCGSDDVTFVSIEGKMSHAELERWAEEENAY